MNEFGPGEGKNCDFIHDNDKYIRAVGVLTVYELIEER